MALLNRFSKLNDRAETGIFTFIVTKSVTRDFHRDATTKDFCFGYHRWAISFQRPSEKVLGVHLLLRNPSPNTSCVVDFTLSLLNREHFSQNEVYTKRQAKFTITNPMQGVARWIQMSDLVDRRFSNETGEFLFELALSNMTTIFECDIQLNPTTLTQYKTMLRSPANNQQPADSGKQSSRTGGELIQLETNYFTFGAFDWSLTIVPLVVGSQSSAAADSSSSNSSTSSNHHLLTPSRHRSSSSLSLTGSGAQLAGSPEPVCRIYLNRLNGFDCLCRVRYRVILGHHQPSGQHAAEFVDSRLLDQLSDAGGRIRGHQFKATNILKLISVRSAAAGGGSGAASSGAPGGGSGSQASSLDLRVHIEMFAANTISEARVPIQRPPNEPQVSNCSDRNKQAWCVEADTEAEFVRLKLFFMDLASVPRNHIRYISWIAYVVRRGGGGGSSAGSGSGGARESVAVRNSPHCNYYLQDGIDMGAIMDTHIPVKELANSSRSSYLSEQQLLTVHIEWVDSLLLFSHLYNNYDALATVQRHQISRELTAIQQELEHLERKYAHTKRALNQLLAAGQSGNGSPSSSPPPLPPPQQQQQPERRESDGRPFETAPPAKSRLELVASVSAPAASKQRSRSSTHAEWSAPEAHPMSGAVTATAPMSLEDRQRFSSSTPPRLPPQRPSVRRRLPAQPGFSPAVPAAAAACLSPSPPGAQVDSGECGGYAAMQRRHSPAALLPVARPPPSTPFGALYQDKMLTTSGESSADDQVTATERQRLSFQHDERTMLLLERLALKEDHHHQQQQQLTCEQPLTCDTETSAHHLLEQQPSVAADLFAAHHFTPIHGLHLHQYQHQQQQQQQQHQQPLPPPDNHRLADGDDFTSDQFQRRPYEHYNRLQ